MPDYNDMMKTYTKVFNSSLPIPTADIGFTGVVDSAAGHKPSTVELTRSSDALWRLAVANDAGAKEGGKTSATSAAAAAATNASHPSITIGRMTVSTEDRWRIQAAMRREEVRSGQARKEYNKKVTRAIINTKGPNPDEAFPPGRGRPL